MCGNCLSYYVLTVNTPLYPRTTPVRCITIPDEKKSKHCLVTVSYNNVFSVDGSGHVVVDVLGYNGRSRVRFPMVSLKFFIDITLVSTQPPTEMNSSKIS